MNLVQEKVFVASVSAIILSQGSFRDAVLHPRQRPPTIVPLSTLPALSRKENY